MTIYSVKKFALTKIKEDTTLLPRRYSELELIVDTREQKPLWTEPVCKRLCLCVGDYSTKRLIKKFSIERKSPGDLYGTMTKGHARFRRELYRAADNGIKLVMFIETTKKKFINKQFEGGSKRLWPSSGLKRKINTLTKKYDLEFVWCKDRDEMKKQILKRLKYEETNLSRRGKTSR